MRAWAKALLIVLVSPFVVASLVWLVAVAGYFVACELMDDFAEWLDDAR